MDSLKIALLGCGYIAQAEHIPALLLLDNVTLCAVVDLRREAAEQVGRKLRLPYFTDLDECLSAVDVDAVTICVEKSAHLPVAIKAARAKKHLLIEKPLATNSRDAAAIIDEAEKNGVRLQVAYMRRFDADCVAIKQLLDRGDCGDIHYASSVIHPYARAAFPPQYIRLTQTESKETVRVTLLNVLLEVTIHHINLLRFWLGDVKQLLSATLHPGVFTLSLEFTSGAIAQQTTLLHAGEHGEELHLYGTRRSVRTKLWQPHFPYEFARTSVFTRDNHERTALFLARANPYAAEIRDFAECVLHGRAGTSDGSDALKDLELIEQVAAVCPNLI